jgi:LysM repeat protein
MRFIAARRFYKMTKTSASSTLGPRLCPTCGTRVGAAATKCLVCGADLSAPTGVGRGSGRIRPFAGSRIPNLLLFVVLALLAIAGMGLVVSSLSGNLSALLDRRTPTATGTATLMPTFTSTPTATETPVSTATPLPPVEYVVVAGDTCLIIAANFNVSMQSIIEQNQLDPNCILSIGAKLLIPQPTPTATPLPTATNQAGVSVGPTPTFYTVRAGETLALIASIYKVTVQDLMEENAITDPNSIRAGQVLRIPLEKAIPSGPTATPTPFPPYPPPSQLLPEDGQAFSSADSTVTLQWTSVGELRPDEAYYVVVEDVTCNCARFYQQSTTENKLIIPVTFRPTDNTPHLFRWTVTTVRQRAGTEGGQPVYDPAGATSPERGFIWSGAGATAAP